MYIRKKVTKMVRCSKCNNELDYLLSQQYDLVTYEFDGGNYTEADREADALTEPLYLCPWCINVLATGEQEARKLLGGK